MSTATGEVKAGRAYVEILLNQTPLERGLKQAQKKIKAFGENLIGIGKNMLAVSGIMAAPLAFATKGFADFDDAMRMVKAVSGATESEFKRLTATAEKLGRETSYTAKQVAEAMTAMGRMGFKPDEILSAVPAVLNLARATGTELGEAAEIAANNMRVFGIETSKMSNVADILTATANGSAQTLSDLAEGLKMAGPQAAAAKDNIVNVSGALGVLANMGIKGSLAGTALRKAYSQFAKTKVQYVDAGENLEDAVRREIREEASIEVKDIRYFGSQTWPYPSNIMIGFRAEYATGELKPDGDEVIESGWFDREHLPQIPRSGSIARTMLDAWVAAGN